LAKNFREELEVGEDFGVSIDSLVDDVEPDNPSRNWATPFSLLNSFKLRCIVDEVQKSATDDAVPLFFPTASREKRMNRKCQPDILGGTPTKQGPYIKLFT
jgi:hypothetical protein